MQLDADTLDGFPLPPGRYVLRLMKDDRYQPIAESSIARVALRRGWFRLALRAPRGWATTDQRMSLPELSATDRPRIGHRPTHRSLTDLASAAGRQVALRVRAQATAPHARTQLNSRSLNSTAGAGSPSTG